VTSATAPGDGIRQYRFTLASGACRILLIRHGESAPVHADSSFGRVDGHGDYPLHKDGEAQAERVSERLVATETIAAIYVTNLQRTQQTAAPLARRLGLEPIIVPELREVFLGEWEGGELRRRAQDGDPIYIECIKRQRWDVIPGAEAHEAFDGRLQIGIMRIARDHPDHTVAVIVHGGVIGQLLARATGLEGFTFARADNASISELVIDGSRQILRRFNDTAHLGTLWFSTAPLGDESR
jgi:probable phosphoglycerate mutase